MDFATIVILGIALSMDAFAVSICKGLSMRKVGWKQMSIAGAWFGFFQGLMPAIGYLLGSIFSEWVENYASWIAFVLLAFIGANMIREALKGEEDVNGSMKVSEMFLLAIATSIDALSVGITFSVVPVEMVAGWSRFINTMAACGVIMLETGVLSMAGVWIGSVFGGKYKSSAQIAGGIILILIGLRILLQHFEIL